MIPGISIPNIYIYGISVYNTCPLVLLCIPAGADDQPQCPLVAADCCDQTACFDVCVWNLNVKTKNPTPSSVSWAPPTGRAVNSSVSPPAGRAVCVQDGALAASVAHWHHRRLRLPLPRLRLSAGQQAVVQLQQVGHDL